MRTLLKLNYTVYVYYYIGYLTALDLSIFKSAGDIVVRHLRFLCTIFLYNLLSVLFHFIKTLV